MRRTVLMLLLALLAVVGLGSAVLAGGDHSTVTRARLERALPVVFANTYAHQAQILGHDGVTPESLHAKAMCDKHGPDVADVGPGGDWVCLMSWDDPNVPMPPEGYGKFELNVHSNDCFTALGQTKLTGFLTITDTDGHEVTNPAFEFDGCFDPNGDDSPTGVEFPSLLTVTSTSLTVDPQGGTGLQVTCGTGENGCSGSIEVTAGDTSLGTIDYELKEESTAVLPVPGPVPDGASEVSFSVRATAGFGPTSPVTLPTQGH